MERQLDLFLVRSLDGKPSIFNGAGGGTRTHTLSPAADFESATSTNSITPARGCARLSIQAILAQNNLEVLCDEVGRVGNAKIVDVDVIRLSVAVTAQLLTAFLSLLHHQKKITRIGPKACLTPDRFTRLLRWKLFSKWSKAPGYLWAATWIFSLPAHHAD